MADMHRSVHDTIHVVKTRVENNIGSLFFYFIVMDAMNSKLKYNKLFFCLRFILVTVDTVIQLQSDTVLQFSVSLTKPTVLQQ
jgi:hypothetical protein